MKIIEAATKEEALVLAESPLAIYPLCEGYFFAVYFERENQQILRNMAEALAAKGGAKKSAAKTASCRANGAKGGRPKKKG